MSIDLEKVIPNPSSNEAGETLFSLLEEACNNNKTITLKIPATFPLSPSFLNASFGFFLDKYGKESFKRTVKILASKAQFERISDYLIKYIQTQNIPV